MPSKWRLCAEPLGPPSALSSTQGSRKWIGGGGRIRRGSPHPDTVVQTQTTGAGTTASYSQYKIAAILSYGISTHQLPYWSNVHTCTIHPSAKGKMKYTVTGQTPPSYNSGHPPVHQSLSTWREKWKEVLAWPDQCTQVQYCLWAIPLYLRVNGVAEERVMKDPLCIWIQLLDRGRRRNNSTPWLKNWGWQLG